MLENTKFHFVVYKHRPSWTNGVIYMAMNDKLLVWPWLLPAAAMHTIRQLLLTIRGAHVVINDWNFSNQNVPRCWHQYAHAHARAHTARVPSVCMYYPIRTDILHLCERPWIIIVSLYTSVTVYKWQPSTSVCVYTHAFTIAYTRN